MGKLEKETLLFEKDSFILHQGDASNGEIYLLIKGQAVAEVNSEVVGVINPGEFFGEMAAILKQPRGATVRAVINCEVQVFKGLEESQLMDIIQKDPRVGSRIISTLARRLGETSRERVEEVGAVNLKLERYRKAISGAIYALDKLAEKYKSTPMREVAEHLKIHSGLQAGEVADTDNTIFRHISTVLKRDDPD